MVKAKAKDPCLFYCSRFSLVKLPEMIRLRHSGGLKLNILTSQCTRDFLGKLNML